MLTVSLGKWDQALSFKLDKKSATTFQLCWESKASNKVYGEADLAIKEAPSHLENTLGGKEQLILVCHNIKFYCEEDLKGLPPKLIIKGISKILGEFHALSMKRRLAGVLLILRGTESAYLTESQKHWVKDFCDLFTFMNKTTEGEVHQLYMPTNSESYKYYLELDDLLEKSILSRSLRI